MKKTLLCFLLIIAFLFGSCSAKETSSNLQSSLSKGSSSNHPLDSLASLDRVEVITNINDFERLGYSKKEYEYKLAYAFLTKDYSDPDIQENYGAICEYYKTIQIGSYKITSDLQLEVEIISGGNTALKPGKYLFDLTFWELRNTSPDKLSNALQALHAYFFYFRNDLFTVFKDLDNQQIEWYNSDIVSYILYSLSQTTARTEFSKQEIMDYSKMYFNYDILNIPDVFKVDGKELYHSVGRGGCTYYYDVISEEDSGNNITTIRLHFYADKIKAVYSDVVEYKLQRIGDFYKLVSSTVIEKSALPVAYWSD